MSYYVIVIAFVIIAMALDVLEIAGLCRRPGPTHRGGGYQGRNWLLT